MGGAIMALSTENQDKQLEKLITANQLRFENNLKGALALYQELASQEDVDIHVTVVIALTYFRFAMTNEEETGENYIHAIDWLQRAIALQPGNANFHVALAEIFDLGILEYERAATEYRKALDYNPYLVSALVGGAALYGVPEDVVSLEEAINWMEQAIKLQPDDANLHARLGDLYHRAGQKMEARNESLRALLCSKPLNPRSVR